MTNNSEFQKELLATVKEGIKPSQLKKAKSADDLETVKNNQVIQQLQAQLNACQTQLTNKEQALTEAQALITQLNQELEQHLETQLANLKQPDSKAKQIKELTKQLNSLKDTLDNPAYGSPLWAEQFMKKVFWSLIILTALTLLGQWLISRHD